MATQEEILQKVNEHCTEKQYTLNDDFRSKFSEKFAKINAEADINDENVLNSIKFNIDTAFSAASKELKVKDEAWKAKESEFLKQIEELKKSQKVDDNKPDKEEKEFKLPDDLKNELEEIKQFKEEKQKQEKRANVLKIAQKNVREDLHGNLEEVLSIMQLDYSKTDEELAKQLDTNFTKIYKGKIGDVRPQSSQVSFKKYDELIKNVPKANVY